MASTMLSGGSSAAQAAAVDVSTLARYRRQAHAAAVEHSRRSYRAAPDATQAVRAALAEADRLASLPSSSASSTVAADHGGESSEARRYTTALSVLDRPRARIVEGDDVARFDVLGENLRFAMAATAAWCALQAAAIVLKAVHQGDEADRDVVGFAFSRVVQFSMVTAAVLLGLSLLLKLEVVRHEPAPGAPVRDSKRLAHHASLPASFLAVLALLALLPVGFGARWSSDLPAIAGAWFGDACVLLAAVLVVLVAPAGDAAILTVGPTLAAGALAVGSGVLPGPSALFLSSESTATATTTTTTLQAAAPSGLEAVALACGVAARVLVPLALLVTGLRAHAIKARNTEVALAVAVSYMVQFGKEVQHDVGGGLAVRGVTKEDDGDQAMRALVEAARDEDELERGAPVRPRSFNSPAERIVDTCQRLMRVAAVTGLRSEIEFISQAVTSGQDLFLPDLHSVIADADRVRAAAGGEGDDSGKGVVGVGGGGTGGGAAAAREPDDGDDHHGHGHGDDDMRAVRTSSAPVAAAQQDAGAGAAGGAAPSSSSSGTSASPASSTSGTANGGGGAGAGGASDAAGSGADDDGGRKEGASGGSAAQGQSSSKHPASLSRRAVTLGTLPSAQASASSSSSSASHGHTHAEGHVEGQAGHDGGCHPPLPPGMASAVAPRLLQASKSAANVDAATSERDMAYDWLLYHSGSQAFHVHHRKTKAVLGAGLTFGSACGDDAADACGISELTLRSKPAHEHGDAHHHDHDRRHRHHHHHHHDHSDSGFEGGDEAHEHPQLPSEDATLSMLVTSQLQLSVADAAVRPPPGAAAAAAASAASSSGGAGSDKEEEEEDGEERSAAANKRPANQEMADEDDAGFLVTDVERTVADLEKILAPDQLSRWDFPVFRLQWQTNTRPLYFSGLALARAGEVLAPLAIPVKVYSNWLDLVEHGYNAGNPYHNSCHGADVAMSFYWLLDVCGLLPLLTPDDLFSCVIAALVHDFDHPGVNNAFLVATRDPVAVKHNDKSVLENHHVASMFGLCASHDDADIFKPMHERDPAMFKSVRETIIELVLATDFAKHFEVLGQFKARTQGGSIDVKNNRADLMLVLKLLLKCADIGHTAKLQDLHLRWTSSITEEFYQQGDREKELGLPVSPFMDRDKPEDLPKSQHGFLSYLVLPLYTEVCATFPAVKPAVDQLHTNLAHWKALEGGSCSH